MSNVRRKAVAGAIIATASADASFQQGRNSIQRRSSEIRRLEDGLRLWKRKAAKFEQDHVLGILPEVDRAVKIAREDAVRHMYSHPVNTAIIDPENIHVIYAPLEGRISLEYVPGTIIRAETLSAVNAFLKKRSSEITRHYGPSIKSSYESAKASSEKLGGQVRFYESQIANARRGFYPGVAREAGPAAVPALLLAGALAANRIAKWAGNRSKKQAVPAPKNFEEEKPAEMARPTPPMTPESKAELEQVLEVLKMRLAQERKVRRQVRRSNKPPAFKDIAPPLVPGRGKRKLQEQNTLANDLPMPNEFRFPREEIIQTQHIPVGWSRRDFIWALERWGFNLEKRGRGGSHLTWRKETHEGSKRVPIPLGTNDRLFAQSLWRSGNVKRSEWLAFLRRLSDDGHQIDVKWD